MGSDIDFGLLRDIITAAIAILIYWIKRSMDKGMDEVKTSLTNINNNISTAVTLFNINNNLSNINTNVTKISERVSSTQVVNVHQYQPPERIKPEEKPEEVEDESVGQ